jgi:hypothetical protein
MGQQERETELGERRDGGNDGLELIRTVAITLNNLQFHLPRSCPPALSPLRLS